MTNQETNPIILAARTIGVSPKAVLAFLYPLIAAIVGSVVSWISTGNFGVTEIRTALAGLAAGALAALGAYVGRPGTVKR